MVNVIPTPSGTLVGGLEWFSAESVKTAASEVRSLVEERKKTAKLEKLPLLSLQYAVCSNEMGGCAVGICPLDGVKKIPKGAISLAVRCAQYAADRQTANAVFAWEVDGQRNLVAVLNGLPIYDAVLSPQNYQEELEKLLSMFETGCTSFGDEALFKPPVSAVSLADLSAAVAASEARNPERARQGRLKTASAPLWAQAALLGVVVLAVGGYFYWQAEQNRAREEAAMLAALEAQQEEEPLSPQEQFVRMQTDVLAAAKGCRSIDAVAKKMLELRYLAQGFRLTEVKADCVSGQIKAHYQSSEPVDLSVRKVDARIRLTENLKDAFIDVSFSPPPARLAVNRLLPWQDWLVKAGMHKQRVSKAGVLMTFGAPSPLVANLSGSPSAMVGMGVDVGELSKQVSGVPIVVKGDISIQGPAQYMLDASRLIDNVVWRELAIVDKQGRLAFTMRGEYYALKD